MDFSFTPEQERFRRDIRDFLADELRKGSFTPLDDNFREGYQPEFSRKLSDRGWVGMTWPKEWGGQGRSYVDRMILSEEMLCAGAPIAHHWMGERQVGPSLIAFGSDAQKKEFLPKIKAGAIGFALAFSEPNAGCDLASVQTRAVEDGDDYLVSGQKIWTSRAHLADYAWLLARTDPTVPKHKGLSQFMLDLKLPGINIRPIIDATGAHHYNEVFFDNVRVNKRYMVGAPNRAWGQLAAQLDFERSELDRLFSNYQIFVKTVAYAKETEVNGHALIKEPAVRNKLASLESEFHVGRLLCYRVAWSIDRGVFPNYEAALSKAYCCEVRQRVARVATEILGMYGQLWPGSPEAPFGGRAAHNFVSSISYTLAGGTSETLRNIIALRGLKLPTVEK